MTNSLKKLNDLDLLLQLQFLEAVEDFHIFRQVINPNMIEGWFQEDLEATLQQFYKDFIAGLRPKLVIEAPPQHGKSHIIVDFIAWVSGKNPDLKTIFASYSDRLGIRANLRLQKIYDSYEFQQIFPALQINQSNNVTVSGQTLRNKEILQHVGREGSFENTTVMGGITGMGLDLGILDDATKGRAEARSKTIKLKTLDWFKDDFFTRFSDSAGVINIQTRWCLDDVAGFMKEKFGDAVKVVSYPAIAVKDEKHRKKGEALFPEFKSLAFLMERKNLFDNESWMSLYQQNPISVGSNLIKGSCFTRYALPPIMEYRKIFGDTAFKTEERHDYSVLIEVGVALGRLYILSLMRGKWDSVDLERTAIDFWNKCKGRDVDKFGALREMMIEDKASGTGLIQGLTKEPHCIPVEGIPRTKDKYSRFMDVAKYYKSGYICIPEDAEWVFDYVKEHEGFTSDDTHAYDDQIDPTMDAINDMLVEEDEAELLKKMMEG
ncbi:MAG: phage terminase large subunit [Candidatus Diapherotrites archaeon]|nr:phage terminase large subunit [Candidatus Diapherotrites archaeon]